MGLHVFDVSARLILLAITHYGIMPTTTEADIDRLIANNICLTRARATELVLISRCST